MARPRPTALAWLLALGIAGTAQADPALEQRVLRLAGTLRCLVCQNQTIADSHAQLALDLKQQVRDQLANGASDQAVLDYMVQRYGDFVLYSPPVKPLTWPLWFGPLGLLAGGAVLLAVKLRQRRPSPVPVAREPDEEPAP